MGGVLVCPRGALEPVEQVEANYRSSLDVFAHKGLALDRRVVRSTYVVYRFNKAVDPYKQIVEFEDGGFALATGTLFYHGEAGTAALEKIYNDYRGGVVDLDAGLQGNYCLLVGSDDELHVLNDFTGYYPVYRTADGSVISSSLIAVARAAGTSSLHRQGFYEFVLNGLVSGSDTVLEGVTQLESQKAWQVQPSLVPKPRQPVFARMPEGASMQRVAELASEALLRYFHTISNAYPGSIGAALSGGYDSRLMLALLRRLGVEPYLYVYGAVQSDDVRVAQAIGAVEGLAVEHVDKSLFPRVSPASFAETVRRDVFVFDGIKPLGILDDGTDVATRRDRAQKAALQLNGAGGEIYREIWNLGDRRVDLGTFLRMRFDRGNYDFLRADFEVAGYFEIFVAKVRGLLGIQRDWIERSEAEMLFPFLRNLFAAPNNAANSQFSPSLVPFMEPSLIYPSFELPIRYKYCGELQARIIKHVDPSLARYDSAYGINFSDPVPVVYRARRAIERHIPLFMRLAKRRLNKSGSRASPYFIGREYLEAVVDMDRLRISEYVDVQRIEDPEILNRALSVEILLAQL